MKIINFFLYKNKLISVISHLHEIENGTKSSQAGVAFASCQMLKIKGKN